LNTSAPIRLTALSNRRFRGLLLVWSGIPIGILYLWSGVLQPLLFGSYLGDFQESYMRAAGRIAAGLDPYDLCQTMGCLEPTGPQYVMPPLLAWLLQPLLGLNSHLIGLAVIVVLNIALALFLFTTLRALRVRDWQLAALLVLLALSFEPATGNIAEGQVNLLLLALSGVWLLAWVDGRWWGGIALGAAVALKLIQAPVGFLLLLERRWSMLAAAVVTGLGLWLVAAPSHLLEYLLKVLPAINVGTGFYENHSPGGTITRLLEPDSFLGAMRGSPPAAQVITTVVGLGALALTLWVLHSRATSSMGLALEAAAIVAVTPLVTSYSWGTHLVLLLLPMLVLTTWAVLRRDWTVLALVAVGDLLISAGHRWLQALLVSDYSNLLVLRLMAEFGVVGIAAIWIASMLAVRRELPAPRTRPVEAARPVAANPKATAAAWD
jgi:hypothetical protein